MKLFWPGDGQTAPRLDEVTGLATDGSGAGDHDIVECTGRIYVAKADKLCVLDSSDRCAPQAIKGARWPRRLGCDSRGRLWLGGYGLARVEGDVAVAVHDLDGFLGGREVLALGRDSGAGLAVAIEDRGMAVLDAAQPTRPTPARAPDEGDRARGDHIRQAVLLWIDFHAPASMLEELDAILRGADAGGYAGIRQTGFRSPHFYEFYGRDARRIVDLVRPRVEKEGRIAFVIRRDGEAGAPETRIDIRPPR